MAYFLLLALVLLLSQVQTQQNLQQQAAEITPTPNPCNAAGCPTPTGPTRTPTPTPTIDPRWTLVGTHPQAAQHPSSIGKQISSLIGYDGKLYAGYGEYNAPDTPTAITYLDPTTDTFTTVLTFQSDGLWNYRIIGNSLYAPAIDTIANTDDYAVGSPDGTWKSVDMGTTTHVYDMVTLTGTDLWMVGSRGGSAVAWRSLDGGQTWQDSLVQLRNTGKTSAWRFYFAGVYNEKLYVQMKDLYGAYQTASKAFDPLTQTWSDSPNMLPPAGEGWRPIAFAGKLLYRLYQRMGNLVAFDGTGYSYVPSPTGTLSFWVNDMLVDDTMLYVLTDKEILGTTDLSNWTTITNSVPINPRSLALLKGKFYVGTTDSKIYRLDSGTTPSPTLPSLPGDVNKDNKVDLLDFNIWRDEFLGNITTKQADLNADGTVDLLDFNIWLTAYKT